MNTPGNNNPWFSLCEMDLLHFGGQWEKRSDVAISDSRVIHRSPPGVDGSPHSLHSLAKTDRKQTVLIQVDLWQKAISLEKR